MMSTLTWILFMACFIRGITSQDNKFSSQLDKLALQMQSVLCKLDKMDNRINTLIAKGKIYAPSH